MKQKWRILFPSGMVHCWVQGSKVETRVISYFMRILFFRVSIFLAIIIEHFDTNSKSFPIQQESLEYWLLDQLIHTFFHKIYIVLTNIADSVSNFYVKSHQTLGSKYLLKRINSNKTRSSSSHTPEERKKSFLFNSHTTSSAQ